MELFGYASLIGVGFLLGMMGAGGSILSVPILVYLFSLDVVVASSYSLFIVGSTSVVGTALKHHDRFIDTAAAFQLGVPSVLATFCTRKWIVCYSVSWINFPLWNLTLTRMKTKSRTAKWMWR